MKINVKYQMYSGLKKIMDLNCQGVISGNNIAFSYEEAIFNITNDKEKTTIFFEDKTRSFESKITFEKDMEKCFYQTINESGELAFELEWVNNSETKNSLRYKYRMDKEDYVIMISWREANDN